ncbi:hypothetical protein FCV25MIE_10701 [Fagus crenata]
MKPLLYLQFPNPKLYCGTHLFREWEGLKSVEILTPVPTHLHKLPSIVSSCNNLTVLTLSPFAFRFNGATDTLTETHTGLRSILADNTVQAEPVVPLVVANIP